MSDNGRSLGRKRSSLLFLFARRTFGKRPRWAVLNDPYIPRDLVVPGESQDVGILEPAQPVCQDRCSSSKMQIGEAGDMLGMMLRFGREMQQERISSKRVLDVFGSGRREEENSSEAERMGAEKVLGVPAQVPKADAPSSAGSRATAEVDTVEARALALLQRDVWEGNEAANREMRQKKQSYSSKCLGRQSRAS